MVADGCVSQHTFDRDVGVTGSGTDLVIDLSPHLCLARQDLAVVAPLANVHFGDLLREFCESLSKVVQVSSLRKRRTLRVSLERDSCDGGNV